MEQVEFIKRFNGPSRCAADQGYCGEAADFEVQGWHFCHYHLAEMLRAYINESCIAISKEYVEDFVIKARI